MLARIAVIGSRKYVDYTQFKRVLDNTFKGRVVQIVSGGARGADTMAERYANETPGFPKADIFRADWKKDGKYEDKAGFCKSATLAEIKSHDYVLTPGRYVGAEAIEDDGIPFEEKMAELSATLYKQMLEGAELDNVIRKNLEVLGYGE